MTLSNLDTELSGDAEQDQSPGRGRAPFFFEVDDVNYEYDHPLITGAEIMAIAGISPNDGLVQVLPDGSRKTVSPTEEVRLVPGIHFKRRPKFKRG
jgi:hypothetical protein